jgi:hypothetical protein
MPTIVKRVHMPGGVATLRPRSHFVYIDIDRQTSTPDAHGGTGVASANARARRKSKKARRLSTPG